MVDNQLIWVIECETMLMPPPLEIRRRPYATRGHSLCRRLSYWWTFSNACLGQLTHPILKLRGAHRSSMGASMMVGVNGIRWVVWTICIMGVPLLALVLCSWTVLVGSFICLFMFDGPGLPLTECCVVCSWNETAFLALNIANSASCLLYISCIWHCISLINSMGFCCSPDSPNATMFIFLVVTIGLYFYFLKFHGRHQNVFIMGLKLSVLLCDVCFNVQLLVFITIRLRYSFTQTERLSVKGTQMSKSVIII